jgi:RecA/RadA recombinase
MSKVSELAKKLLASSKSEYASMIEESEVFKKTFVQTEIPIINAALSGHLDGGLTSGHTVLAGESRSFKTLIGLFLMRAYLNKFPDAVAVMYDNEFGSPPIYLEGMGIDTKRLIHVPFTNVEQLKFSLVSQLDSVKRGDKVYFFIDSIGAAASKKELEDAQKESSAADMTRAKQIKSLFRMITPYFSLLDIPLVTINHIYMTQELYAQAVVSGGTGVMLSADTCLIITKSKLKETIGGKEKHSGFQFNINVEKSRFVKEKSRLPLTVRFDRGIDPWSGLFELGLELGYIVQPKNAWYARTFLDKKTGELVPEAKNWRKEDTKSTEFWTELIEKSDFAKSVSRHYALKSENLVSEDSNAILAMFENAPESED